MLTREEHLAALKQESSNGDDPKISTTTTWSELKDPRIVRVSRAMGGKDRHSKVCTVRGLRDRRVRLSVPTAIQLYDLQERLGLNQPSKAVDWLLNAAKNEIDELPPLEMPQGITFTQMMNPHHQRGLKISDLRNLENFKDVCGDRPWTRGSSHDEMEVENNTTNTQAGNFDFLSSKQINPACSFSSSSYSAPSSSSHVGAMGDYNNNSFGRWEPSNLTLSHTPISLGLTSHQDQSFHNFQQHQHQLLVYHQSSQPYYVPQINGAFDTKLQPSFHTWELSSTNTSANVRPFSSNTTADLLPSPDEQTKRNSTNP